MTSPRDEVTFAPEDFPPKSVFILVLGAAVVGAATGLVGVAFLFALKKGVSLHQSLVATMADAPPMLGWLAIALIGTLAAAVAAWLVERFAPTARGSGVPYVERILRTTEEPCHRGVMPVKFFGGILALSSGLILGREGPMVQMGAVIGEKIGRFFPGVPNAWRALMTAGAGAGLSTAFNAPVGGTLFILEEVQRRVTPLSFVLAATATVSATFVQRALFQAPRVFDVPHAPEVPAASIGFFLVFGLLIGVIGVAYNRLLLGLVALTGQWKRVPVPIRAGAIGALVATVGWLQPSAIGGGDEMTQSILSGSGTFLLGIALLRFFLGPLSYVAGTPGGLFAPIIALGALLGLGFGEFQIAIWPGAPLPGLAFAIAGMAALFTATIRAPITGIVICLEMTGTYSLFYPMLAACLGAYLVPTLAKCPPIYDSLAKPN
ncbi:MAG: H(+)/Cl(-) exchange transporter ClcA [Terrimicrobiaceae bacterium]